MPSTGICVRLLLTLTECCYLPNIFPFIRCVAAYSSSFFYFHTHQSFPSYLQLYSSLYNLLMEFSRKSFFISPNTPLTYHLIGDLQALDMYNHPCKISFLCAQMSEWYQNAQMLSTPKLYAVRDMILISSDSQKLVLECHEWMLECKPILSKKVFHINNSTKWSLFWFILACHNILDSESI